MDRIYRRETHTEGTPKKKDEKARQRNQIMNFRVSPEERELIESRIVLSGLTKSRFFIDSCMNQTIHVQGNVKTFTEIKNQLSEIKAAVKKSPDLAELSPKQQESLRMILQLFQSVFGDDCPAGPSERPIPFDAECQK